MSITMPTFGEMRSELEKKHDEDILDRVEKGLKKLQEVWGDEWVNFIDPRKLNMNSGSCCVLGQIWRGEHPDAPAPRYSSGYNQLVDQLEIVGSAYGFDVEYEPYSELDEVWSDIIHELKGRL